jgi:secreted trypsin-like serine protease
MIAGWGSTSKKDPSSPVLKETKMPILEDGRCRQLATTNFDYKNQLCTGHQRGGTDACFGGWEICNIDSGGPLFTTGDDGKVILVGLVSHGGGCSGHWTIFTRISRFKEWIIQHV